MYAKIFTDSKLTEFWKSTDKTKQKNMNFDFLSRATGGPNNYTGKSMVETHKGRGVHDEEFNIVIGHIVQTMSEMKIPPALIVEVTGLLKTLKEDIVEVAPKQQSKKPVPSEEKVQGKKDSSCCTKTFLGAMIFGGIGGAFGFAIGKVIEKQPKDKANTVMGGAFIVSSLLWGLWVYRKTSQKKGGCCSSKSGCKKEAQEQCQDGKKEGCCPMKTVLFNALPFNLAFVAAMVSASKHYN